MCELNLVECLRLETSYQIKPSLYKIERKRGERGGRMGGRRERKEGREKENERGKEGNKTQTKTCRAF